MLERADTAEAIGLNQSRLRSTRPVINQGAYAADTDHDRLPDEWELANGLDPNSPDGLNGPLADPDGDGANNYQEYIAGTDPHNPSDYLRFDKVSLSGSYCVLKFTPRAGRTYAIEALDGFQPGSNWVTLTSGISGTNTTVFSDVRTPAQRFYRLNVALQP